MTCVEAEVLRVDFVELQPKLLKSGAHNPVGCLRLFQCLWPAIHERADRLVAVSETEIDTFNESVRGRPSNI